MQFSKKAGDIFSKNFLTQVVKKRIDSHFYNLNFSINLVSAKCYNSRRVAREHVKGDKFNKKYRLFSNSFFYKNSQS